jgi:hypothetical protein
MKFRLTVSGLVVSIVAGIVLLLAPPPAHASGCLMDHYCTVEVGGGHQARLNCYYDGANCYCPAIAEIVFNNCEN